MQGVTKHNNFNDLSTYALTCFITPASNAVGERITSLVTAMKTKPQNKSQIKLMDTLVGIRSHLLRNAICFNDFECASNMIKLPNSVDLYGQRECSSINDETVYLEDILH